MPSLPPNPHTPCRHPPGGDISPPAWSDRAWDQLRHLWQDRWCAYGVVTRLATRPLVLGGALGTALLCYYEPLALGIMAVGGLLTAEVDLLTRPKKRP